MKRLVLGAASAVMTCSSLVLMAGSTPPAAATTAATVAGGTFIRAPGHPHLRATHGVTAVASTNWGGYVQETSTQGTFTAVTDTFVVPTITGATKGSQYAADWVGIGGYDDPTLVQAGIQAVVKMTKKKKTTVSYDAWTEILPKAEKALDMVVAPGDVVTVTVQEIATNKWLMQVQDGTQVASRTVNYKSRGLSVEAIHERPCIMVPCGNVKHLAQLAQTTNVTFEPGFFSEAAPGQPVADEPLLATVPEATLIEVPMVANDQTTVIATPSDPNAAADGFAMAYGSVAPPAPTI